MNEVTFEHNDLVEKWKPILEHENLPQIKDSYRKSVTATLLENQENARHLHEATPANTSGNISKWDPVLIGLVRRAMPALIAFDVAGVQPMPGPTSLVFAMRARYGSNTGPEALYNEADTSYTGAGTHTSGLIHSSRILTLTNASASVTMSDTSGLVPGMLVYAQGIPEGTTIVTVDNGTTVTLSAAATSDGTFTASFIANTGTGKTTAAGEGDINAQMVTTIEKISVEAMTRALKAEYSEELSQDMRRIHNLDAETELANILSNEILAEINREFLRSLYQEAKLGALYANTPGSFDLQVDADGRWSAERFKGLHIAIEREANRILYDTKRGKGNVLVCSADVATALAGSNVLNPAMDQVSLNTDWSQSTFAGTIGQMKVYIDPYAEQDFFMVGYKGVSPMDAGYFYCPYVPLQMYRAVDNQSFQPKIAFKTRYGKVANPLFSEGIRRNGYYRIAEVRNIL